uniref:Uncharacterized protein n=1 Tax=Arundo donax TaxID=35708 RepID=A0A0A9GIQ7_ARUDO
MAGEGEEAAAAEEKQHQAITPLTMRRHHSSPAIRQHKARTKQEITTVASSSSVSVEGAGKRRRTVQFASGPGHGAGKASSIDGPGPLQGRAPAAALPTPPPPPIQPLNGKGIHRNRIPPLAPPTPPRSSTAAAITNHHQVTNNQPTNQGRPRRNLGSNTPRPTRSKQLSAVPVVGQQYQCQCQAAKRSGGTGWWDGAKAGSFSWLISGGLGT